MPFQTPAWDLALFQWVNESLRNPFFDVLMPLVSSSVFMWGLFALCIVAAGRRTGQWRILLTGVVCIAVAAGLADMSCNVVKDLFGRVRPLNAVAGVHFMQDGEWTTRAMDFMQTKTHGNSFVSAHAANSMAAACMAALLWPRVSPAIFLLPLIIGFSRLYLGKHYPADVMGGWILGAFLTLLLWQLAHALGAHNTLSRIRMGAKKNNIQAQPEQSAPPTDHQ